MVKARHKFFLLPAIRLAQNDFESLYMTSADATLSDDIVNYIYDSLSWIPSLNPSVGMHAQSGLNLCGITVISTNGAVVMKDIFEAWHRLFQLAPSSITLTGQYILESDETSGYYELISLDKKVLLREIIEIIKLCERVIDSTEEKFILHLGI